VTSQPVANHSLAAAGSAVAANGPSGTDVRVQTVGADGTRNGQPPVRITRILHSADSAAAADEAGQPCLSASWRLADGTQVWGVFATARYLQKPPTLS
jgi:hypothetical protein